MSSKIAYRHRVYFKATNSSSSHLVPGQSTSPCLVTAGRAEDLVWDRLSRLSRVTVSRHNSPSTDTQVPFLRSGG
ncbi:hypothetical protein RRG08_005026 [Elysia crispata]|uniref:Uncharacterized protein n=1 Tax=Elysia crispata TaxID=231223 RepID=A0AAE1E9N7_9GAST|nr:hypothetical protein RRG08_005026 [Elysia crispata]